MNIDKIIQYLEDQLIKNKASVNGINYIIDLQENRILLSTLVFLRKNRNNIKLFNKQVNNMKKQNKVYIEIDGYSKKPFKLLDENNKPIIIDKKDIDYSVSVMSRYIGMAIPTPQNEKDIQKICLQAINKSYIKTFNHLTIGKQT